MSLLLHTAAVLWLWRSWGVLSLGFVFLWMDFPVSLAYLRLKGGAVLAGSLAAGGLEWAAIGALLSLLVARSARH